MYVRLSYDSRARDGPCVVNPRDSRRRLHYFSQVIIGSGKLAKTCWDIDEWRSICYYCPESMVLFDPPSAICLPVLEQK